MNKPLITIITVSYNAVSIIEETILSVINQTYPNIEYIVIDGGSTDGTIDIIKKYEDKINYWISEPDKGIYDAMNKGISVAKGEWINFMNCGDSFYSTTVIENIFNIGNIDSDIIYGNTNLLFKIGNFVKKAKPITAQNYMPFMHQSSFVKTSIMKDKRFDCKFKICADRHFYYESYKTEKKFQFIDLIIANYEADEGISATNLIKLKYEIGVIEGKTNNLSWKINFIFFQITYRIKQFIKKILPPIIISTIKKKKISKQILK